MCEVCIVCGVCVMSVECVCGVYVSLHSLTTSSINTKSVAFIKRRFSYVSKKTAAFARLPVVGLKVVLAIVVLLLFHVNLE